MYSTTDVLIFGFVGCAVLSGLFFLGRWMADQDSEGVQFIGKVIEFVVGSILVVIFLGMVGQMTNLIDVTK